MNIKDNRYSFNLYEKGKSAKELFSVWKKNDFWGRLHHKDWSLWTEKFQPEIIDRLGWLDLPERMTKRMKGIRTLTQEVKKEKFSDLILIGMGGSSLAPEVFQRVFNNAPGFPRLTVCDSTHPQAVKEIRKRLDLRTALFVVSSKSGTTLETLSLFHYFWAEVEKGGKEPGKHFIAITDYGTPLMREAQKRGFRKIFNPYSEVGGRFSVFTEFGLVPASLIGMDIERLLEKGREKADIFLGAALGSVGKVRDKLYFVTSRSLKAFPDWVEQLVAESLGKDGRGIIPVIDEPWIDRDLGAEDRFYIFCYLDKEYREIEKFIRKTKEKEVPSIEIKLQDQYDLGNEITNWETAAAAAGAYFNIHPFNQPDVQAAKDFARGAMEDMSKGTSDSHEDVQTFLMSDGDPLKEAIYEWLSGAEKGDYAAVQVYLAPSDKVKQKIQKIREEIQKKCGIATTMGYGPRFLHSTGQLHKGGPNKGLFLQIVDSPKTDIRVPGKDYSFGSIIKAQSVGDFKALRQKDRRILRIDLKDQPLKELNKLIKMIKA
ncbi:MAG: hypothetical protein ACOC5S_04190 [Acidobacteriota bacterium]